MANTYTKIASVAVGSGGAANMSFSSIPSTYTDLCLKVSGRTNVADYVDFCKIQFNGVATNQTERTARGNGSAANSYSDTLIYSATNGNTATSNTFGNLEAYITNYAGSTNKALSIDGVSENNATAALAELTAGLWSASAAITSITLVPYTGTLWQQYSTATLYGIVKS
jgi:hypothetical protein